MIDRSIRDAFVSMSGNLVVHACLVRLLAAGAFEILKQRESGVINYHPEIQPRHHVVSVMNKYI